MTRPKNRPTTLDYAAWHNRLVAKHGAALQRVITTRDLENLRTERGGYTRATLEALGVPCGTPPTFQPPAGWKRALVGRDIPAGALAAAEAGRGKLSRRAQRTRRRNS